MDVEAAIHELVRSVYPGARIVAVESLAPDAGVDDSTAKTTGYGQPRRISVIDAQGRSHALVLHTESANEFGHDRRSDRAQQILLSFDTFGAIPRHVRALDVGAVLSDGRLLSLRDAGELYLLTSYATGRPYADDLRRIARDGVATPLDVDRCDALARYLASLHRAHEAPPGRYRRAIRDLIGHGEGIFGIIDGYPDDVPAAPPRRLRAIERGCAEWRWRLRDREQRLVRTHGDFHPFNVVFDEGVDFTLLDASRGGAGDPADDVMAMTVNYVFFALERPEAWARGLGVLWRRFFSSYLEARLDRGLLEAAPPFLAWRGLVVANPRFYPRLGAHARDQLLGFVERVLDAQRLDLGWADELFAARGEDVHP